MSFPGGCVLTGRGQHVLLSAAPLAGRRRARRRQRKQVDVSAGRGNVLLVLSGPLPVSLPPLLAVLWRRPAPLWSPTGSALFGRRFGHESLQENKAKHKNADECCNAILNIHLEFKDEYFKSCVLKINQRQPLQSLSLMILTRERQFQAVVTTFIYHVFVVGCMWLTCDSLLGQPRAIINVVRDEV